MRNIVKRTLITLGIGFISFIIASTLSFLISRWIPGDPVLPYLPPGPFTEEAYNEMFHRLGLDQPIIVQYFIYIANMLSGAWGFSLSIYPGSPVFELIVGRQSPTVLLIYAPLLFGTFLGFRFGISSLKIKSKKENRVIYIISVLGFAIPIVIPIFASQIFLSIGNAVLELIILWIILTISIMALTMPLSQMYLNNLLKESAQKRSAIIFILLIGMAYGILFVFLVIIETIYSFGGIGELFLQALVLADYYILNAIIFLILCGLPVFIIFILLLFYIIGCGRTGKKTSSIA